MPGRVIRGRRGPLRGRGGAPKWMSNGKPDGFTVWTELVGQGDDSIDLYMLWSSTGPRPIRVQVTARNSADVANEFAQFDASISEWVNLSTGEPDDNPSIQGSILGLDPEVSWDIKWEITFDNGETRYHIWDNISTRAVHTYVDTDTLVPTRYLSETAGNDNNDGLTLQTAWQTVDKAVLSAPTNAIVGMDDGCYYSSAYISPEVNARNANVTFFALNKRIGDGGVDLDNGNLVRIEPVNRTSPTGSGHHNAGVWEEVTLSGRKVYRWASSTITSATVLTGTYRTDRMGTVSRLMHHTRSAASPYLDTAEHWAEWVYTNQRHNDGFWIDTDGTVYCRIMSDASPDTANDLNPNDLYLTFADIQTVCLNLKNGANSRVSGINIIGFDRAVHGGADGIEVDHCWFTCNRLPFRHEGDDQFFAHSLIDDSHLAAVTPTHKTMDWGHPKLAGIAADGTTTISNVGRSSEGTVSLHAGKRLTVENCRFIGAFNGIGGIGSTNDVQRLYSWGTVIRDNFFDLIADDCAEPEQGMMCIKIYRNRFQRVLAVLSTAPVHGGPVYFYFNEAWQNSANYIGRRSFDGGHSANGKVFSKFSSESEPQSPLYIVHNTFFTNEINPDGTGAIFAGDSGGGQTSSGSKMHEKHYWYGNFIICPYRIMDEVNEQNKLEWFDDYNYYFTYDDTTPSGIKVGTVHYQNSGESTQMARYRQNTNQGAHSNINPIDDSTLEVNGTIAQTFFEAQLEDAINGNLALKAASPLRNIVPPCPVTVRLGQALYNVGYQPLAG